MSDQPTPDALSRASAYLDGELDAAEIAAAEADPAVMAEGAQLRALQESIRDVDQPTSYARDTAIAAALVEFDRRTHPVSVVRTRPRPSYSRWLAVAAAVAGLAALGAVIATTGGRGGDDDDAAGAVAKESAAGAVADQSARVTAEAGAPQAESVQSQTMLAPAASSAAPEATAYGGADAATEAPAAPATTAAAAEIAASAPPPFDPNTPIPNELELGRIGRQLLAEWEVGSRDSKTGTPCDASIPDVVLLSDALLIVDGAPRPVLVAGNRETRETYAVDPDTCVIVMTGQ